MSFPIKCYLSVTVEADCPKELVDRYEIWHWIFSLLCRFFLSSIPDKTLSDLKMSSTTGVFQKLFTLREQMGLSPVFVVGWVLLIVLVLSVLCILFVFFFGLVPTVD